MCMYVCGVCMCMYVCGVYVVCVCGVFFFVGFIPQSYLCFWCDVFTVFYCSKCHV